VRFSGLVFIGLDLVEGMYDRRNHQPYRWIPNLTLVFTLSVVLAVRTYAVWKRNKRVGIGLALLLGLYQIPNAIIWNKFVQGVECEYRVDSLFLFRSTSLSMGVKSFPPDTSNPYPELYKGCVYNEATRLIFVNWVIITVVEGGMPSTTQFRRVSLIRAETTQLILF